MGISPISPRPPRDAVDWEERVVPYLKARHAEIAGRLAKAAAKGDLGALQLESGRLLEVEGLLGLEALLREPEIKEREDDGRRSESRLARWGRRWLRGREPDGIGTR